MNANSHASYFTHFLERQCELGEAPGVAAVLTGETDTQEISHGVVAFGSTEPMGTATRMPVAALTEPLTALAVLQLVALDKLNLDTPIGAKVSNGVDAETTARQLLTHTAGLSQLGSTRYSLDLEASAAPDAPEAVTSPNRTLLYSPHGYALLAQLVEHLTGATFADHVRSAILEPLAMNDTNFVHDYEARGSMQRGATGTRRLAPVASDFPPPGAGGLVSTAADIGRFVSFWASGNTAVLPERLRREALRTQWHEPGDGTRYGFGFEIVDGAHGPVAIQTGQPLGWHHGIAIDLETSAGCAVLTNAVDADAGAWAWIGVDAAVFQTEATADIERFTGVYESAWSRFVILAVDDDRLAAVSLDEDDPFEEPDWLNPVDGDLLIEAGSIYSPVGEKIRFGVDGDRMFYGADEIRRLGPLATI